MSLHDIGPTILMPDGGKATRAKSHLGEIVTVQVTDAALQDYQWGVIWPAAENLYSDGRFNLTGETKVIRVTTTDCKKWMDDNA